MATCSASSYDLEKEYMNNAVFVDCGEDLERQTPTIHKEFNMSKPE